MQAIASAPQGCTHEAADPFEIVAVLPQFWLRSFAVLRRPSPCAWASRRARNGEILSGNCRLRCRDVVASTVTARDCSRSRHSSGQKPPADHSGLTGPTAELDADAAVGVAHYVDRIFSAGVGRSPRINGPQCSVRKQS
jgi:hypothetical protein